MDRIADNQWEDDLESELGDSIAEAIDDFGADFDAEGNPIEEGESDRIVSEDERGREARTDEGRAGDENGDEPEREEQAAAAS
jgi:F-type H+/Na+-transporting ATPase subunit alpha